jgi:hypothetical protein
MMDDRAMPGHLSMSTLTIHLRDDKHERLKALAKSKSISVGELMIEIATVALDNNDARVRYETRSARQPRACIEPARQAEWCELNSPRQLSPLLGKR